MFWIQALLNVKVISVILTLFYLHRGLALEDIFYLSIIWAISTILFEIPSSYMADMWGRKRTILVGIMFALLGWIFLLVGDSFVMFAIALVFSSLQFASFSGTDEALIYDSNKELGAHTESLRRLSHYYSGRNVLKIVTPLIAVFFAQDLLDWQFAVVISIDIVAVAISFVCALMLSEPHHYMDVTEQEAGIMTDAVMLIKNNPLLIRGIMSKTIVFIASFIIWRYHQDLFVHNLGISVIAVGCAWSVHHTVVFLWERYVTPRFHGDVGKNIDIINMIFLLNTIVALASILMLDNIYAIMVTVMLLFFVERIRMSLFSQFFNTASRSFNRATTISLSNFLKSLLDLPLLFIAAIIISRSSIYPFIFIVVLSSVVVVFFRLSSQKLYVPKTSTSR